MMTRHSLLRVLTLLALVSLPAALLSQAGRTRTPGYCYNSVETLAMRCADGRVTRHDSTLVIRLGTGESLRFEGHDIDNDMRADFRYRGLLRGPDLTMPGFHIVFESRWEEFNLQLINEQTGESVSIAQVPVVSPSGQRFATMNNAACGDMDAVVEIWRIGTPVPTREFETQPYNCATGKGWLPRELKWRGNDQLIVRAEVEKKSRDPEAREFEKRLRTIVLSLRGGRWRLP